MHLSIWIFPWKIKSYGGIIEILIKTTFNAKQNHVQKTAMRIALDLVNRPTRIWTTFNANQISVFFLFLFFFWFYTKKIEGLSYTYSLLKITQTIGSSSFSLKEREKKKEN